MTGDQLGVLQVELEVFGVDFAPTVDKGNHHEVSFR